MIVMPNADMDHAVDALKNLTAKVRALNVGPGTGPEMGPLATKPHLAKVRGYIDADVQEGAKLIVDGRELRRQGYEGGYLIGGSLFDRVTTDMTIYCEEIDLRSHPRVGSRQLL
ncbi:MULTISPECIES: aldehyde dehydrogenase family protein [Bradyrhizobium]|uniref:aldehyde dehydrogenase family protein n=1 Tax=Bradyrhizobium centrosematis TaxID=1300039 RepID=UPI0035B5FC97|nr:acyl-CoA reductase-like NAD-dependent aldehyde dehydrogenase [Bradyrhizobium centrosematis]MCS3778297.1 acyl-CoA reductase-like NAD-dependent aldehyde dehydrogenase [Bradyrhizobium centrosematis]